MDDQVNVSLDLVDRVLHKLGLAAELAEMHGERHIAADFDATASALRDEVWRSDVATVRHASLDELYTLADHSRLGDRAQAELDRRFGRPS